MRAVSGSAPQVVGERLFEGGGGIIAGDSNRRRPSSVTGRLLHVERVTVTRPQNTTNSINSASTGTNATNGKVEVPRSTVPR